MELCEKNQRLYGSLKALGSVAVAFSGGVDSTFLLSAAVKALGKENVTAITARARSFPERELDIARGFCKDRSLTHLIFDFDELAVDGFSKNPPNRCYLCKTELFTKLREIARENGSAHVIEGSNADDSGDFRPGMAAVAELGIKSPLRECELTKDEIRALSREMGLPTWDKPSLACLASRFVYGEEITAEKLSMVGRAEELLLGMGIRQVRVRVHGKIARIETDPAGFSVLLYPENRLLADKTLKGLGFDYVALDLKGYRTGSMNIGLDTGNLLRNAGSEDK